MPDLTGMPIPHSESGLSEAPACTCTCNGEALELVVTAPRVGPFPELRTYRCADCGHVVTLEAE